MTIVWTFTFHHSDRFIARPRENDLNVQNISTTRGVFKFVLQRDEALKNFHIIKIEFGQL